MKFQNLYKLIEEASNKAGKSEMKGRRYHAARNSEGPAGKVITGKDSKGEATFEPTMPSSPVGKVDNMEVRQPLNRWEYDPDNIPKGQKSKSGFSAESKIWKSMLTSFGILMNEKLFIKQFDKIADNFKKSLDGYKNMKGYDDEGNVIKYDEENKLESLTRNDAKYDSKLTGIRAEIEKYNRLIALAHSTEEEQLELLKDLKRAQGELSAIRKFYKKSDVSFKEENSQLLNNISRLKKDVSVATGGAPQLKIYIKRIEELTSEYEEYEEKSEKVKEELSTLRQRIQNINENNRKANDRAVSGFIDLVQFTASSLISDIVAQHSTDLDTVDDSSINWGLPALTWEDKIARLKALASDDEEINPILGYLERFKRQYEDNIGGYDSREHDKNVNITQIRQRNNLPFAVLLRIFASMSLRAGTVSLEKGQDSETHTKSYSEIETFVNNMTKVPPFQAMQEWGNPENKNVLKSCIQDLAIPENSKNNLIAMLYKPFVSKGKLNSFYLLKSSIDSEIRSFKPKNLRESFDDFVYNVINSNRIDEDDMKLELMEALSNMKK